MKWFVGVDGGGSKTDFAVSAGDGKIVATLQHSGCSYLVLGVDATVELLVGGVRDCLAKVDATLDDCVGCCIGLPCYGENARQDSEIAQALHAALAPVQLYLANDVEVGWAGALGCGLGVHLVSGTGSIAFGRSADGRIARCGGWSEFFGDEGSCYWVGREAMSVFSKQADGRIQRGALYDIVRKELSLEDDFQFIDTVLHDWVPYRDKVARFQLFALQAAEQGDASAVELYQAAANELALMVQSIKSQLSQELTAVSYSGGLFRSGKLVLAPLQRAVEALGCTLQPPLHSPIEGALLLAIEHGSR